MGGRAYLVGAREGCVDVSWWLSPGSCPMPNFSPWGKTKPLDPAQGPIARDESAGGCMQACATLRGEPEKPDLPSSKTGFGLAST